MKVYILKYLVGIAHVLLIPPQNLMNSVRCMGFRTGDERSTSVKSNIRWSVASRGEGRLGSP